MGIYVVIARGNLMSLGFSAMGFVTKTMGMIFLTWSFTKLTEKTWAENKMLRERISELETKYTNKISYEVTVTTYNPTIHQCDDTPHITADGTHFKTWKATEYRLSLIHI